MKKFLILLFLFSISQIVLNAESVKTLMICLDEGDDIELEIPSYLSLHYENDNLVCLTGNGDIVIPMENVKRFMVGEKEIDPSDPENPEDPENPDDSGINEVEFESDMFSVYSMEGNLLMSGIGKPDLSLLPKGKIYIVKQGKLTYKFLAR